MRFRPLHHRLVVKRIEDAPRTKGGIVIPETAKERPQQGKVVAAGPGRLMDDGTVRALNVAPGDHVLFDRFAGSEFQLDGEEHLILSEDDVLAVLS